MSIFIIVREKQVMDTLGSVIQVACFEYRRGDRSCTLLNTYPFGWGDGIIVRGDCCRRGRDCLTYRNMHKFGSIRNVAHPDRWLVSFCGRYAKKY